MKWLKSWLTMKRGSHRFVDVVSGESVYMYTDCFGDKWLAYYSRWGFRMPDSSNPLNVG